MQTLHTTADQLHDMLAARDKVKSSSTTVKVDKAALINLLMDNFTLRDLCKGRVSEPTESHNAAK